MESREFGAGEAFNEKDVWAEFGAVKVCGEGRWDIRNQPVRETSIVYARRQMTICPGCSIHDCKSIA